MAHSQSIKPTGMYNAPAGYVTEEQLLQATGIGKFTLDRWRRDGLIPWRRENCSSGRFTIYPKIAIEIVLYIKSLPYKGFDCRFFAVWLKGYDEPVEIVSWVNQTLQIVSKTLAKATIAQTSKLIKEVTGKGRLRGTPQQAIFGRKRDPKVRKSLFEWGLAVGRGTIPEASVYDCSTETSPLVKAMGGRPDPQLDIENTLAPDQLRAVINSASTSELERARQDCARLANVITGASSMAAVQTREAAYASLIGLWGKPIFRAVLVSFLIHVRRQGYGSALDKFLEDFEVELLRCVSMDTRTELPDERRETGTA